MKETVEYLNLEDLQPFANHPFKLRDVEEKERLLESIQTQGAIEPLLVRPFSESKYEIISGHRRFEIYKELGIQKVPVIIRNLDNEQAVTMMVDSNLHRENIFPSEKAFAYKMKLEAVNKQGKRTDLTSGQVGQKWSRDEIADTESGRQIQRYIRLTNLIPELLQMVDDGRIAFTPAVELSYLAETEQRDLLCEIEYADATPSLSQAQRLRDFSKQGRLNRDVIFAVMSEEKANQKEQVKFPTDRIRKYFPKGYTTAQMEETIVKLCEAYHRKRVRDRESR